MSIRQSLASAGDTMISAAGVRCRLNVPQRAQAMREAAGSAAGEKAAHGFLFSHLHANRYLPLPSASMGHLALLR
jgi:hypothetical protein